MWKLVKAAEFSASHTIPWHKGRCRQLHGHTYKVKFEVWANTLTPDRFVVDFSDLKALVQELDHQHLNDLPGFEDGDTTAEHIAYVLARRVYQLNPGIVRVRVTVWETPTSSVSYEWAQGQ